MRVCELADYELGVLSEAWYFTRMTQNIDKDKKKEKIIQHFEA